MVKTFSVIVIPQGAGSYCYYAFPSECVQMGCFIDVADRSVVDKFREEFGITEPVTHILSTHKSLPHSGANLSLKQDFPKLEISGSAEGGVPGAAYLREDGDRFGLFNDQV